MQKMVDYVAGARFPQLERRRGAALPAPAGTGWWRSAGMLGSFVAQHAAVARCRRFGRSSRCVILGWVNQRPAALRRARRARRCTGDGRASSARRRGALYLLGLLLALAAYVPFVGFFAPVVFGLAFIHYLLGALAAERAAHKATYRRHENKTLAPRERRSPRLVSFLYLDWSERCSRIAKDRRVPQVTFRARSDSDWKTITTDDIFKGKNVVVFSLPGAFTPTCSSTHVPRYNELAPAFFAQRHRPHRLHLGQRRRS